MSRTALFAAMLIGNIGYYVVVSGTLEQLIHGSIGAGSALFLHWLFNR